MCMHAPVQLTDERCSGSQACGGVAFNVAMEIEGGGGRWWPTMVLGDGRSWWRKERVREIERGGTESEICKVYQR